MSPNPGAMVGIDPDHVEEIPFGGAVFFVGPIPSGVWERIRFGVMLIEQDATRRAVRRLAELGLDPEGVAKTLPDGFVISHLMIEMRLDPEFNAATFDLRLEAVRLSVRDHQGVVDEKGVPRACVRVEEMVHRRRLQVLSPQTLRWYDANRKVVDALWPKIRALNTFEEDEKKASPRP